MRKPHGAIRLARLEQAYRFSEDSTEVCSVDLIDDKHVRTIGGLYVGAVQVPRANLEPKRLTVDTRIQPDNKVLVRTRRVKLHHLV